MLPPCFGLLVQQASKAVTHLSHILSHQVPALFLSRSLRQSRARLPSACTDIASRRAEPVA